jgi:replicative DNA helicase
MRAAQLIGPHNLEAEAALLGAMLIDNRLIDRALDRCEPHDMAEPLHQRIYQAIVAQQALGRKATPITLKPVLESDPALAEVGGVSYLAMLTQNGAALLAADDFADQIRELAKLRAMRRVVTDALDGIEHGAPVHEVAATLEAAAWTAQDTHLAVQEMSFGDAIRMVQQRQAEIDAGVDMGGMMCATISDLDTITGGLQPGWMLVLAGRPGSGKTATATSMALGYASNGVGTLLISLEMSALELGQRVAADAAHLMGNKVLHHNIRDGKLDKLERDYVHMAADMVEKLPLMLVDAPAMAISRVGATVRRAKRKMAAQGRTLQLVIVDYLQLIQGDRRTDNRVQEVSEVSRGLKALAKQEGVCIVALAQLSRNVESREDKRPMLADLRDSGQIEQDADVVIFLYREEYYLRMAEPEDAMKHVSWEQQLEACRGRIDFIGAKQRHGAPQTLKGYFLASYQAVRGSDFMREWR